MTNSNNTKSTRIPVETKISMALDSIRGTKPITDLAKDYKCSRTTVYAQQEKALIATSNAFHTEDNNDVLFKINATKEFIKQQVLSLFLICKSSYRDTKFFFSTMYNYDISIAWIHNIIYEASAVAEKINESYDLSSIKSSASDEVFHQNEPINTTVDIDSRFCAQAIKAGARDGDTWNICLLLLIDQGYKPQTTIIDGATGLLKGYTDAIKTVEIRHDHFHIIRDILNCVRYLSNKEKSATTKVTKLKERLPKTTNKIKEQKLRILLQKELINLEKFKEAHQTFQLLASWLQHDILQLAGYPPVQRAELYDFILSEITALGIRTQDHRIQEIETSLIFQRDRLLVVSNTLNTEFTAVALKYKLPVTVMWDICYLARYGFDSCKYQQASNDLECLIGEQYDAIEDEILNILDNTHRTSSIVENFHSRLHPYLDENKTITQTALNLIRFYLNHKPFMRSAHQRLVNKTPAEALTGKPHKPWLTLLSTYNELPQAA